MLGDVGASQGLLLHVEAHVTTISTYAGMQSVNDALAVGVSELPMLTLSF